MYYFLRATAATAVARLSHRNSVCPSVCPSVTRVDQSKTVQGRIIKSSPSAEGISVSAGLLHGLTVMQQCVCQIKFRNVCEVKKRPVWSRTLSILMSMNRESISLPVFT